MHRKNGILITIATSFNPCEDHWSPNGFGFGTTHNLALIFCVFLAQQRGCLFPPRLLLFCKPIDALNDGQVRLLYPRCHRLPRPLQIIAHKNALTAAAATSTTVSSSSLVRCPNLPRLLPFPACFITPSRSRSTSIRYRFEYVPIGSLAAMLLFQLASCTKMCISTSNFTSTFSL